MLPGPASSGKRISPFKLHHCWQLSTPAPNPHHSHIILQTATSSHPYKLILKAFTFAHSKSCCRFLQAGFFPTFSLWDQSVPTIWPEQPEKSSQFTCIGAPPEQWFPSLQLSEASPRSLRNLFAYKMSTNNLHRICFGCSFDGLSICLAQRYKNLRAGSEKYSIFRSSEK